MEIVKNHYIKGKKVESFDQIEDVAAEMITILNEGLMLGGLKTKGYALAHNQVEDKTPLAFFVLSDESFRESKPYPSQIIINPEILEPPRELNVGTEEKPDMRSNIINPKEACFSFPHKKPKRVTRYFRITVRYQYTKKGKLIDVEEVIEGLKAHIFQHEWQHTLGENIFYTE